MQDFNEVVGSSVKANTVVGVPYLVDLNAPSRGQPISSLNTPYDAIWYVGLSKSAIVHRLVSFQTIVVVDSSPHRLDLTWIMTLRH